MENLASINFCKWPGIYDLAGIDFHERTETWETWEMANISTLKTFCKSHLQRGAPFDKEDQKIEKEEITLPIK